jgi:hypothetical protein
MADIASKNIDMGQNLTQKALSWQKRLSLLSRLKKIKKTKPYNNSMCDRRYNDNHHSFSSLNTKI